MIYRLFTLCFFLIATASLSAQSLEQAKRWLEEKKYAEAKPVFEKSVKQAPNNASYHFWYGVCAYETGDMEMAESYLSTAVGRKVTDAYPYLINLYIKEYRFAEALNMVERYDESMTKAKKALDPSIRSLAELAEKAQRMVNRVESIQIIDSVVTDKDKFLSAYKLSEEAGSVSTFKQFFHTDEAVEANVYMNGLGDKIFYAHPGADGAFYGLYTQSRLAEQWGDEKRLPNNINVEGANTNYPFVTSDGLTIYYASDGGGSIGGYDLFVTRYNINSDSYLAPEHLGMPFNSLSNDYMMVVDEVKNLGWFASDRRQPADKVCIYLFIPDPQRSRIEEDNASLKRSRAMIASIAETWKADANYAELVRSAHTQVPKQREKKKDFEFVINNNVTYYVREDIKSSEARALYEKCIQARESIGSLEKRMDDLRTAYRKGDAAKKSEIKDSIIRAEEELYELLEQPSELEKRARNAEISFLLKNNR